MPKTIDDRGMVTLNIDAEDLVQLAIRLGVLEVPEGWTLRSAWESSWTLPNSYLKITAEFAPPRPPERDLGELCDAFDRRFAGDKRDPATDIAELIAQTCDPGSPEEEFRNVVRAAHRAAHAAKQEPVRRRYTRTAIALGVGERPRWFLPYVEGDTREDLCRRLAVWTAFWSSSPSWLPVYASCLVSALEGWLANPQDRPCAVAEDSWYPLDPADLIEAQPPR